MRKIGTIALVAGLCALTSCGGYSGGGGSGGGGYGTDPGTTTCPANTVCLRADTFSPTSLTVAKGTTVTFDNSSSVNHNVIFDPPVSPGVADIGAFPYGTTDTRTFGTVGTFNFHCTIHPATMIGKIVVQ